jgi:hypothetical protein
MFWKQIGNRKHHQTIDYIKLTSLERSSNIKVTSLERSSNIKVTSLERSSNIKVTSTGNTFGVFFLGYPPPGRIGAQLFIGSWIFGGKMVGRTNIK